MFVVHYRKIFFIISALLMAGSIAAILYFGLNFGIDFKGGTITQVSYPTGRPDQTQLKTTIDALNFGNTVLQPVGDQSYVLRTRELSETEKQQLLTALTLNTTLQTTVDKYDSIGPVIGEELRNKAYAAIVVVMLCIVLFITYVFRGVSEPLPSWKFGLATIISLVHDVIIPTGAFVLYAHFRGGEIDVLFVSALLAILGYSVHDTIVVFDRVREHLRLNKEKKINEDFETTVGKSVSETFGRSINTSLTIFIVLVILYAIGSIATREFSFVLLAGVIVGTYSSIFVASPLLVTLEKLQNRKAK
ncbi:MAG: protein translocase subunit SecF [bacterium]|nr:protein translocase subunit SecF [bacterium]